MQSKTLSFKQAVELHSTARFTELHGHRHVFAYFIYNILLILLLMLILDLCKPVSQPVHTTVELLKGAGVYRVLHFAVHGRIRIVLSSVMVLFQFFQQIYRLIQNVVQRNGLGLY